LKSGDFRPRWTTGPGTGHATWSPAPLALNTLLPPLPCRLRLGRRRRSCRPERPACSRPHTRSACRFFVPRQSSQPLPSSGHCRNPPEHRRKCPSPPPGGSGCSESQSGRARLLFLRFRMSVSREAGCGPVTP
jgi:hypothetical protein